MRRVAYDRVAAVEYARRWAMNRNPKYYDFEHIGGDCTNFVSQCLFAGSGTMNYTPVSGWYYRSLSDRAPAWSSVKYLYQFLLQKDIVGPRATVVTARNALLGDIVQLGRKDGHFYHTLIITEISPQISVTAHSYDALYRPLTSYEYEMARFLHIETVIKG
ncbi:MAG: amidase domain-containing protein [Clostridia bacterium]|nr:amidase domain-containing protein [Clostridia bacterium]